MRIKNYILKYLINNYLTKLITIFNLCALHISCGKNTSPCLHTTSKKEEKEFTFARIRHIKVKGIFAGLFIRSNKNLIKVSSYRENLSYIKIQHTEDTILIENKNICRWLRLKKNLDSLYIFSDSIKTIEVYGHLAFSSYDSITTDSFLLSVFENGYDINILINANTIEIKNHTGSSAIILSGRCNNLYLYSAGYGFIYANSLNPDYVHIYHKGTGDFHVFTNGMITGKLAGAGNLILYSKPSLLYVIKEGYGKITYAL